MNFYEREVLPRFIDLMLRGKQFGGLRAQATEDLAGEVLEVGFGSGTNVPYYPPTITRVRAVDPAMVGQKLAAKRLATSSVPVEFIGLTGESIPLDSGSVDHVLSTWTLCTIPDVDRALHEMRRVLKPGGTLHFVEHGASPDPKVRKWQDRINPVEKTLFGGCHVNRTIDRLIDDSGLEIVSLENHYLKGPKTMGYMYVGTATKS